MFFTNGDHQAFESLMRDKPGDHYDSGVDGPFPECRSCRCHRPFRTDRFCQYEECPYAPGRMTAGSFCAFKKMNPKPSFRSYESGVLKTMNVSHGETYYRIGSSTEIKQPPLPTSDGCFTV